jgi:hypothetical protein
MENRVEDIVNETVSNDINELSKSQKKRNFNCIRTIIVLRAENPGPTSPRQVNKSANSANSSLVDDLKVKRYICVPAKGQFGNNLENSYAIFNMSLDVAKKLSGKYQQTSFIMSKITDNGVIHSEYWESADTEIPCFKRRNDYVMQDECDECVDMSADKDVFTIKGKKFKYELPYSILESINQLFSDNIKRMIEIMEKHRVVTVGEEDRILKFAMKSDCRSPYLYRRGLTRGFYKD